MSIARLGIVGSGIIGSGIAECAAMNGFEVVLRSRSQSTADATLADHHRVKAGCYAEDMEERSFIEQAVEVLPFAQLESIFGAQQPHHGVGGQGDIGSPQPKLSAVAGGHYDDFLDAFRP